MSIKKWVASKIVGYRPEAEQRQGAIIVAYYHDVEAEVERLEAALREAKQHMLDAEWDAQCLAIQQIEEALR